MQLDDIIKTIKIWNGVYANQQGSVSIDVSSFSEVMQIISEAKWEIVKEGKLLGARFFICEHGVVLQQPQPSNEMSLIGLDAAKMLGIIN